MGILFTHHALNQIKNREITTTDVINCIKYFDNEKKDDFGNIIAQKLQSTYLLRVIYRIEGPDKVIITAYRTSRVKKYL